MKLELSPYEIERYRRTNIQFYNMAQKTCRGCKRLRSSGQFDEGAAYYKTCVRRGVK